MVPIYDTDVAEQRWARTEWDQYELWEKIEVRQRRKRQAWIAATVSLFLALSSVPILMDRWPKWTAMSTARKLAQEINQLKREAILAHQAFRLRFFEDGTPRFRIEKSETCKGKIWETVREGSLLPEKQVESFVMLSKTQGEKLGIPGLIHTVCYDSLAGMVQDVGGTVAGFGIIPVKDLTESRADRMSVLILSGVLAETTFD